MQVKHLRIRVIFLFRQSQQVVGGYTVELGKCGDTERTDVFEIIRFIIAKRWTGQPGSLRKLF